MCVVIDSLDYGGSVDDYRSTLLNNEPSDVSDAIMCTLL